MNALPSIALALIVASAAIQAAFLFRRDRRLDPASHWILLGAFAALAATGIGRSLAIGFPALTGSFDALALFSACVCLIAWAYRAQGGSRKPALVFVPELQFGATMAAAALLAIASSPIAPREVLAPIPALRSAWLVAHVSLSIIGESFFAVSFVASLAFLASRDEAKRLEYDKVAYASVAAGYPIFTVGALVFGAIWAEQAWGSWWSWDPKEIWALVTWLAYTAYLHLRLVRNRRDALPAIVAAAGFLCALFTFLGVNFLLPGLHSYN
jgi:ABC-type transport system involved in cytochrome c biogenesis permease subunit